MTNEEVIELLMELRICKDDCSVCRLRHLDGDTHCHHEKALNLAIKALEQTEWIPVSERLPEKGKEVLATYIFDSKVRYVSIAERYGDEPNVDWASNDDEYKLDVKKHKVIAWQPLPKPYAESEE